MNDQQLTQVLDAVDEATTFAPGESKQLVPLEQRLKRAPDDIVESATRLGADIVSVYEQRVEEAQRDLEHYRQVAQRLIDEAQQMAGEVKARDEKHRKIGEGVTRTLADNGVEL
ncbi:MAG TPA: hypothetical protein VF748_00450 [Candidatus Acidoferrum sp.]